MTQHLKSLFRLIQTSALTVRNRGFDRGLILFTRYVSWKLNYQKVVSELPERINNIIFQITVYVVNGYVSVFQFFLAKKYTDADPYKIIYVDPSNIESCTGEIYSKRRGWVVDGEWDKQGAPYMDRTYATAISQRFKDGLEWDETVLAEKYDHSTLEARGEKIDSLYHSIREGGYKSQKQLLEENPHAAWNGLNDVMHPIINEIAVDIGRNGELLWNICGQHRLAIAKILDLDQIPVQVFRRHVEWQNIRNKVKQESIIPIELNDHPDLCDLK